MLRRLFACASILVLPACGAKGDDNVAVAFDAGPDTALTIDSQPADTFVPADAPFDACVSQTVAAKQIGLAMMVLIDRSGSMFDYSKWDSASKAIRGFVDRKETVGLDVGLTFFPPESTTADMCSAETYVPSVAIAPIPGNTIPVQKALLETVPGGGTPMAPALRGAIASVRDYVTKTPNTEGVVILVTDGDPSACGTIGQVTAEAMAGVTGASTDPKIRTFVVGMDGAVFTNLDAVAAAAGTTSAFNVGSGYTSADLLQKALDEIRIGALGCDYLLETPDPKYRIEYDQVSVKLTAEPGATPQSFGRVNDKTACTDSAGGFFYDNNDKPTRITLCDASCKVVQAARRDVAKLDIDLGCLKVVM